MLSATSLSLQLKNVRLPYVLNNVRCTELERGQNYHRGSHTDLTYFRWEQLAEGNKLRKKTEAKWKSSVFTDVDRTRDFSRCISFQSRTSPCCCSQTILATPSPCDCHFIVDSLISLMATFLLTHRLRAVLSPPKAVVILRVDLVREHRPRHEVLRSQL